MRHKHSLSGHLLTLSTVVLIAVFMLVQAGVALREQPTRMFSFGIGNIAFGYGTDSCSTIELSDSFEDGTLTPFGTSGNASWTVTDTTAFFGTFSAQAGTIAGNESTTITTNHTLANDGIISFGRRVSSEENFDFLRFYINDVLQESWSGEVDWAEESYAFSAGEVTFRWTYTKDAATSSGSDTAWIDMVRVGEDCGAASSSAASSSPSCGDGAREGAEACDDGDITGGDGCSATCTVESGWQCTGSTPDVCSEICGDGIVAGSEACDDGNASSGDGCSNICAEESGWNCTGAPSTCETTCGDGIEAGAEACDDGNADNTDACLNTCIASSCGDGFIQAGETCDDSGESATCDVDCSDVVCGDQRINVTAGEACDDGNSSNTDACINTCQVAICGDLHVRAGVEQCEPSGGGTCSNSCVFVTGIGQSISGPDPIPPMRRGPPPSCGNGILEPQKGEKCDDGRFNGFSPTCDRWCGITFCGDGKVHPDSEECEPEQTENGIYIIRTCGVKTCTLPVCTEENGCIGGCRWLFLPVCRATPLQTASSSSAQIIAPVRSSSMSSFTSSSRSSSSSVSSAAPVSSVSSASQAVSSSQIPVCGNGTLEQGEECDDGADNSNTLPESCRTDCRVAFCGDGVTDAGEQCDDANGILGDGCTPLCTRSTCGNGVLEHGEECDEGPRNSNTTPDSCSLGCLLPRCGDGVTDVAFGESCDNGEGNSNTAPGACRVNCALPRCGDGVTDAGEQCDDGNMDGRDACSNACLAAACGNGILEWNEACDDGNRQNGDGCSISCLHESQSFLDWFRNAVKLQFGW